MALYMTPPVSPLSLRGEPEARFFEESPSKRRRTNEISGPDFDISSPICFSCLGEASKTARTHPQSYLQKGAIERLIHNTPSVEPNLCLNFRGYQFVSGQAMDEQMDILFSFCHNQIDTLTRDGTDTNSFFPVRLSVRSFFQYLRHFCESLEIGSASTSDFLRRLLKHLHILMLSMGQIHELPNHVITSCFSRQGNQSLLGTYHVFHLHLDVNWSIAEILHILLTEHPEISYSMQLFPSESDDGHDDIFSQFIRLLMWDIVSLSHSLFQKTSLNDVRRCSPFPCSCVKELVLLVIKLLDLRHEKQAKQSFWACLYTIFHSILGKDNADTSTSPPTGKDSDKLGMPPEIHCSDGIGFCWWLLLHFAPLYKYDQFGVPQSKDLEPDQCNYFAIQTLLKTMMSKRLSEGQFRSYLRYCLSLSELWGPNADVVIILWEHFYKRLNEPFKQATLGINAFASANKTAASWLDQCKERCSGDQSKLEVDSSYQLFLRIIHVHLRHQEGKPNPTWNKLKGRFYTKFHARRMQELTEIGLINFTSLFLTLAITTGSEDVVTKLCDLLASVAPKDSSRRATIYKGLYAALICLQEAGKDVGFIADKLSQDFNSLSREACTPGLEPSRYTELFILINLYLDSAQDVIDASPSLNLSEHKLIGPGLGDLLKICRDNELRNILSFCQGVLGKLRMVVQCAGNVAHLQLRAMGDKMWMYIYNFTKTHATTETPPSQLADVAANFALFVMNSPPSIHTNMKEDFIGVFSYFGWHEQVSTRVSCRFLNHLLPNQSVMESISEEMNDFETSLIAAWFRCAWQVSSEDPQMSELTRLLMKLQQMKHVFEDTGLQPETAHVPVVQTFIQALGMQYTGLTDLREKVRYQATVNAMLGDVVKHIITSQRPGATEEQKVAYRLGGLLAKYCAQILYIKSNPRCIFPELISRLALPRILLNPNKPIPQNLLSAINETLHLFMHGLSKLDFRRDPYIQRKIREVVTQYMTRFPIKASISLSVSSVHPILGSLSESCMPQPGEEAISFRHYVLKIVRDEFILAKGNHSHISTGLCYVSALLGMTDNAGVVARDCELVLHVVLNAQLVGQSQASSVMQQLLEACALIAGDSCRSSVSHTIELFVTQQLGAYQGKVMKILESVATLYPAGVIPAIPAITGAVLTSESKRGVGVDKQLRVLYVGVLQHLGSEGQTAKSAMLTSSL